MRKARKRRFRLFDPKEVAALKTRSGAGPHRDRRKRERSKAALRKRLLEEVEG